MVPARSEDDRREAAKLLVDVAKTAITLSAGAIAVNGAFLREAKGAAFWLFLSSIIFFIISILCSLTAITRTIERAGGDRDGASSAWAFQNEKCLLELTSVFGGIGIVLFVLGTVVG